MGLIDIVKKLTGPNVPIGDSDIDRERLENLRELIKLTDLLLREIDDIAVANKDRIENSMKVAGELCADFFTRLGIED